jgi:hypothetical protein
MKYLSTLLIAFCLFDYGIATQAQNAIPAAGGNASGSGGSVSYSIGQVAFKTFSGTTGTVAQGVQQPYEISIVTSIANTEGITLEYKVYPNPARGFIILAIKPYNNENLRYRLYDLTGILLQDKKVESEETEILMVNFSSAIYFLKVIKDNQEVKVFKIVKN